MFETKELLPMTQAISPLNQEQALQERPHLAFVIECLGLASLAEKTPHQGLLDRLGRCLKTLGDTLEAGELEPGTAAASLTLWLGKAVQEFRTLSGEDFTPLLNACTGNTMPDWLKDKIQTELGEAVTDLIRACLEC